MLGGTDGWLPTDYTQLTAAPKVTLSGKTLSWEADDQVRSYVIFKDGAYLTNTTETSYTVTEDGIYTIRTANEMGGLSTEEARIAVGVEDGISAIENEGLNTKTSIYNLAGQRVDQTYKGLVIKNGKNTFQK